jgi:uncharacterized protein
MYNLGDSSWKGQPKHMSLLTFRVACSRIKEHCISNNLSETNIAFHGGEPMLAGLSRLMEYRQIINEELEIYGIRVSLGIQTNGTFFSEELGDFFIDAGIDLGISIDGPPEINDIHRVDHKGNGSGLIIEQNLKLISSQKFQSLLQGVLCVVNVEADPKQVLDYFFELKTPMIDVLIPDDNYERLPLGKTVNLNSTLMGNWLVKAFDHWYHSNEEVSIRYFENIIKLILGSSSNIETVGTSPADFIIVETNGDIELLDSLKGSFEGATKIGVDVYRNSFDEVAGLAEIRSRQVGIEALCKTCKDCPIVNICGGGYLPHRYSSDNGFDNPSVYCSDLKMIINHIYETVSVEIL